MLASLFVIAALCAFSIIATVRSQTGSPLLRRITNTADGGINLNPSLSGDGRHLAFESTRDVAGVGGPPRFRAIRADVTSTSLTFVQFAATPAHAAAISQDGSRIAFAATDDPLGTNPDGNSEIFLFDGAVLRQLTNTSPCDITERVRQGNLQLFSSDDVRFIAFAFDRGLAGANRDAYL